MKASELIRELQTRIDLYGDLEVLMRTNDSEVDQEDFEIATVYGDNHSLDIDADLKVDTIFISDL